MTSEPTTTLSPAELRACLYDALLLYSSNVEFLDNGNPIRVRVNSATHSVYIRNLTSTGAGRSNPHERRMQLSNSPRLLEASARSDSITILAYSADDRTFTAWDPASVVPRIGVRDNVSLYSDVFTQVEAQQKGIAAFTDTYGSVVLSFRPEYVGLYLDNVLALPTFSVAALRQICNDSDSSNTENGGSRSSVASGGRIKIQHTRYARDPMFRRIICDAYSHTCAICGLQLELVEAAHVVPHCHANATDDVTNGLCLCALHHTAYDKCLIYISDALLVCVNEAKMTLLEKLNRGSGIDTIRAIVDRRIILPTDQSLHPSPDNIILANRVRGIDV